MVLRYIGITVSKNSSGGPSGHINVNHRICFKTLQLQRLSITSCFSGKAAKNSGIFHAFKFTSVHICNYYLVVASDHLFKAR